MKYTPRKSSRSGRLATSYAPPGAADLVIVDAATASPPAALCRLSDLFRGDSFPGAYWRHQRIDRQLDLHPRDASGGPSLDDRLVGRPEIDHVVVGQESPPGLVVQPQLQWPVLAWRMSTQRGPHLYAAHIPGHRYGPHAPHMHCEPVPSPGGTSRGEHSSPSPIKGADSAGKI